MMKTCDICGACDDMDNMFYGMFYGHKTNNIVCLCEGCAKDKKQKYSSVIPMKNIKKTINKTNKYTVHYSFYLSDSIEVEASSEKEAEQKVQDMIIGGEIGNLNEMDVGDSEIWVD